MNRQIARLPQVDYTIERTRRRLLEPHLDALVVELARVLTAASLLAPLKLLPSIEALTDAMSDADERGEAWQQRWNQAPTGYFVECRKVFGSGIVERSDGTSLGTAR